MNNALTTRMDMLPAEREWQTMLSMAEVLFKSGMLPSHVKSAAATVAIVQKGRELGIPPMHALTNIAVIQGKPTANSELMLALIYRDHGDEAIQFTTSTPEICEIAYKRRSWKEARSHSFTMEEARRAGLVKQGPWMTYPAAMLRARCISAVARMAFPDSIGGMYTAEELGAEVDHEGQVIAPPARAYPPASGYADTEVPMPRRTARALASVSENGATVGQQRLLWKLARDYYGDEVNEKFYQWIEMDYPEAKRDGKPSIQAMTAEDVSRAIDILNTSIAQMAERAEAPIEGEVVGEQAALIGN